MPTAVAGYEASVNGGPAVPARWQIDPPPTEILRFEHATKPSPRWEYTDRSGHFHTFAEDKSLPTLTARSEHVDCDGSCGGECEGEGWLRTVYACRICDAPVQPRWVPDDNLLMFGQVIETGGAGWQVWIPVPPGPWLGLNEPVSVRLTDGTDTLFGIALYEGGEYTVDGGTAHLVGTGPLSRRLR